MTKSTRSLRNYVIRPKYQLYQVARSVSIALLISLFQGACFIVTMRMVIVRLSESFGVFKALSSEDLLQAFNTEIWMMGLIGTGLIPLAAVLSLINSHKTAGPVYRITRALEELRDGKTDVRLKFRKGDQFQELVSLFNEAMDRLQAKSSAPAPKDG